MYKKNPTWVNGASVTDTILNAWENGIFEAYMQSENIPLKAVSRGYTYNGSGYVATATDTIAATIRRTITYSYTGDLLTGKVCIIYDTDGTTELSKYTDTYAYDGSDNLTTHSRVVNV